MMKMHGLGDGPYWMITYGFFLALSVTYMLCFVIFGSVLGKNMIIWLSILGILPLCLMLLTSFSGLKFFTLNDYSIQFVFYFIYINLQISTAFLLSSFFSNVKTGTGLFLLQVVHNNWCVNIVFSQISLLMFLIFAVTAYIGVFGTGLLGRFLFQFFVQETSFPSKLCDW